MGSVACQNAAVRPPWCQAGSREQGKPLTLDGGGLDQTGKVQEMQEKGRVEARNSSTDFHGEISPGDSRGSLGLVAQGAHQWPSPEVHGPLGTNHTVGIPCLLWSLGCPVLGYLAHPPVSPWRVWEQMLIIFGKLCHFGPCHFSHCQECKQISEKPKKSKILTPQIYFTTGSERDQVYLERKHL